MTNSTYYERFKPRLKIDSDKVKLGLPSFEATTYGEIIRHDGGRTMVSKHRPAQSAGGVYDKNAARRHTLFSSVSQLIISAHTLQFNKVAAF